MCRILNGMWQVSGGHGFEPIKEKAVSEMSHCAGWWYVRCFAAWLECTINSDRNRLVWTFKYSARDSNHIAYENDIDKSHKIIKKLFEWFKLVWQPNKQLICFTVCNFFLNILKSNNKVFDLMKYSSVSIKTKNSDLNMIEFNRWGIHNFWFGWSLWSSWGLCRIFLERSIIK